MFPSSLSETPKQIFAANLRKSGEVSILIPDLKFLSNISDFSYSLFQFISPLFFLAHVQVETSTTNANSSAGNCPAIEPGSHLPGSILVAIKLKSTVGVDQHKMEAQL